MPAKHPMTALPKGFSIEVDGEGDFWLCPPEGITIFSVLNEPWLITDEYMTGKDWADPSDIRVACNEYLRDIAYRPTQQEPKP